MSLPIYVRENTLLAIGKHDNRPDYDFEDGLVFSLYQLSDGAVAETTVASATGDTVLKAKASRNGSTITLSSDKPVLLVNAKAVSKLTGGTSEVTPIGVLLTPIAGSVVTFDMV
jgi:alpha-D-xyloside xylohydrolase